MKRVMTLVGTIIGTVFTAIYSIIMLVGITAILEVLSAADNPPGTGLVAVVSLLITIIGVLALIFNAIAIGGFWWDHEKYVKKRGLMIAAIVFNCLLALLLIISIIGTFTAFAFMVMLASLAAAVLIIVDMALEGKRVQSAQIAAQPAEEPQKPEQPQE